MLDFKLHRLACDVVSANKLPKKNFISDDLKIVIETN